MKLKTRYQLMTKVCKVKIKIFFLINNSNNNNSNNNYNNNNNNNKSNNNSRIKKYNKYFFHSKRLFMSVKMNKFITTGIKSQINSKKYPNKFKLTNKKFICHINK